MSKDGMKKAREARKWLEAIAKLLRALSEIFDSFDS